ncbi:MAG: MATE family efflux transporter [Oscillospiraceae bacterium]|nr:MATE family efflux transporter [Oscillospiraceae bacterium]
MKPLEKGIEKQFVRYVLPSIFTQLLMGFYSIVDGFFVGRYAGDTGLAAINLTWPVVAVIQACAVGLGTGGAVLAGTRLGQKNKAAAVQARGTAILLLFIVSLVLTLCFSLALPLLLTGLGAKNAVRAAATDYLQTMILGGAIQLFAGGLAPLLRNFGHTVGVMAVMVAGGVCNVALDALFIAVLGYGARGAAVATLTAQGLTLLCFLIFLFSDRRYPFSLSQLRLSAPAVRSILSVGLSPLGLFLAPSITLLFTNWQCLRYGGDETLAAYAVAAYVAGAVGALLSGVGEGIQPLVSYAEGADDHPAARRIFARALRWSLTVSLLLCAAAISAKDLLGHLFGCGPEARVLLGSAMVYTAVAFPLLGLCKLLSSYFYAGHAPVFSSLLIYIDPLCAAPLLLLTLPLFFGVSGIWASYPVTYVFIGMLGFFLFYRHEKKKARP